MQWTCVFWVLMSTVIIVASASNGPRNKRFLSLLTRFFSNNMRQSQEDCTKSYRKPREYEIFIFPDGQKIVVETAPKINNDVDNILVNTLKEVVASNTVQVPSKTVEEVITNLPPGDLTEQRPSFNDVWTPNPRYTSDHRFMVSHKSRLSTIPENRKIVYDIPQSPFKQSVMRLGSPIIAMPRKYSYKQIRGETIQNFSLDKNSDVTVTESIKQPPRPAYVDDRIKDVIVGVSPSTYRSYSSAINDQSKEASGKPHFYGEPSRNFIVNTLLSKDTSLYTGQPIVVTDTSKDIKTPGLLRDGGKYKIMEWNIINRERGDIPEA